MKISHIEAYEAGDDIYKATLSIIGIQAGSIQDAVNVVLSVIAGKNAPATIHQTPAPSIPTQSTANIQPITEPAPIPPGILVDVAAAPAAEPTGRRSRPRNATPTPTEAPPPSENVVPMEGASRRRRNAPEAAPVEPPKAPAFTDVDMLQVCSNAAASFAALGEDGPGMVMAILADFNVPNSQALKADQRPEFVKAVQEELRLAELEQAEKAAG